MNYLHCAISAESKTVYYRSSISGHEWSENLPVSGFYVSGGKLGHRRYNSLQGAKTAIDFDYKYNYLTYENNPV